MNVVVNGLMANYHKVGQGSKALVFLPGWGDSAQTFAPLFGELKHKYEIYTLDLPGFGGSQTPPKAWGLDDYADFLAAWIKKTGIKPYALAGHSYGGAVAITALSQQKYADKLVLLASAGVRNKKPLRKKALAGAAKAGKLPLLVLPKHKQNQIKSKFYGSIGSDLMLLPHMQETFRKIIGQDVTEQARQIKIPTLLIYGTDDKSTPPGDGRLLSSAIPGSRLEIIDAGHFLHQEQPDKVAALIGNFLGEANKNV